MDERLNVDRPLGVNEGRREESKRREEGVMECGRGGRGL